MKDLIARKITKYCSQCAQEKVITDFYRNAAYCKSCQKEYIRRYFKSQRWMVAYYGAVNRCKPDGQYGKHGIKNYLTKEDVKFLWDRDHAELMKNPSIDRVNPAGDYTIENSRFIELTENVRRPSIISPRRRSTLLIEKMLLSNKRSLDEVAKELNRSPKYISRLFKEILGVNFTETKLQQKMQEAKALLEEGILSVRAIAQEIGYKNSESFIRAFKKHFSITPAKFMKG